jgi:hypothetical protein
MNTTIALPMRLRVVWTALIETMTWPFNIFAVFGRAVTG